MRTTLNYLENNKTTLSDNQDILKYLSEIYNDNTNDLYKKELLIFGGHMAELFVSYNRNDSSETKVAIRFFVENNCVVKVPTVNTYSVYFLSNIKTSKDKDSVMIVNKGKIKIETELEKMIIFFIKEKEEFKNKQKT